MHVNKLCVTQQKKCKQWRDFIEYYYVKQIQMYSVTCHISTIVAVHKDLDSFVYKEID